MDAPGVQQHEALVPRTLHGVRKQHLGRYLDEFVFRWNRRRHTLTAFDTLLRLAARLPHASMREFVQEAV